MPDFRAAPVLDSPMADGYAGRAMQLDLDITYIVVLALFLAPLLLLNALVFRPFLELFEARHDRLEGALERADQMLAEAEREAQAFSEQIRAATQKGLERRNAIRQEATDSMNRRIEEERQALQKKLDEAVADIQTKRDAAMAQVQQTAESFAETTASKLLGREAA